MLDAVAIDGVGMTAAHLHELEVIVARQLTDARHSRSGGAPGLGTRRRSAWSLTPFVGPW